MAMSLRSVLTAAMIAFGGLVLGLFGLCTAYVWVAAVSDLIRLGGRGEVAAYDREFLKVSLVAGLLPTVIGGFLLWAGLRRRARLKPPRAARPPG